LKYDPTRMVELKKLIHSEAKGDLPEITLKKVAVGKNLVEQVPSLLDEISGGRINRVLIVTDESLIKWRGRSLRDAIVTILHKRGIETEILALKSDETGLLHADIYNVMIVRSEIRPGVCVIGIGGGTITDICKYAAYLEEQEKYGMGQIPLVVCQTATSGSAFGSNQSVIFKDGVKRTFYSIYPSIVFADMDVIAEAPRELNLSGFGDMIAVLISPLDWYVSHAIGMSPGHCELLVDIMQDSGRALLGISRQVGEVSPEGMEVLAKILVMMGIVSSMGYGTTPISGFEHMISHALDMQGLATGRKLALHGAQVGLGAAYASVAYNLFVQEFSPERLDLDLCYPTDKEAFEDIAGRFAHLDPEGKTIEEIWAHYKEKVLLWRKNRPSFEKFLADWNKPGGPREQMLTEIKPAEQIIEALFLAGNPTSSEELVPLVSEDEMKFAFLNARFMRNRFIIADILGFTGMMNENFWHRVNQEVRRIKCDLCGTTT